MMKSKKMKTRKSRWSDLPKEQLEAVAALLDTRVDILNFKSVCKNWLHSSPQLPPKPLSNPLLPLKFHPTGNAAHVLYTYRPYTSPLVLVQTSVCLLRPTAEPTQPPWLISVEELNPGKLFLRQPFSRTLLRELPDNCPKVINFSKFNVTPLFTGYYLRYEYDVSGTFFDKMWSEYHIKKVILHKNPSACGSDLSLDDYTIYVLYGNGQLLGQQLGGKKSSFEFRGGSRNYREKYVDIVSFKGKVYAVDRRGRVYVIGYRGGMSNICSQPPLHEGYRVNRKIWLAPSSSHLYLIYIDPRDYVKAYGLNEDMIWSEVESFGDDNILFVTYDGCFFASALDFPGWRGNSIVLAIGCFPTHQNVSDGKSDSHPFPSNIAVCFFDEGKSYMNYGAVSPYPRESLLFWRPPAWLSPEECSPGRCSREDEQDASDSVEIVLAEADAEESSSSIFPSFQTSPMKLRSLTTGEDKVAVAAAVLERAYEEASGADISQEIRNKTPASIDSVTQYSESATSRIKFDRFDIRSDLVPTLQKIWAKHGNITEGSAARVGGITASALESLVEVVEILQGCSGRSLNDDQADFLSSALSDLQFLRFKVDWLVPFVRKAVARHQNKSAVDALAKVEKNIAEIEARKLGLLDELNKVQDMEKGLKKERNSLLVKISITGQIDVDQCLGDGLC